VTLHALPHNVGRLGRPRETPQSSQGPARASPRQAQVATVSQQWRSAVSVRPDKCRLLVRQSVTKEPLSPQVSGQGCNASRAAQGIVDCLMGCGLSTAPLLPGGRQRLVLPHR